MTYDIDELRNAVLQNVNAVYDIFKDTFGEANTDLQVTLSDATINRMFGTYKQPDNTYEVSDNQIPIAINEWHDTIKADILVHWADVTITNEFDKSVGIKDLFAKVTIDLSGRIPYEMHGFTLNRSRYSLVQYLSNFMHSHICNIPTSDYSAFQMPCLGSGPIRNTIVSLKTGFDETMWMLFCQELALYVTVESISGVPYHRLESIGASHCVTYDFNDIYYVPYREKSLKNLLGDDIIREFTKYYLENGHLHLSYKNRMFVCGMDYYEFLIDISNAAIDFLNVKCNGDSHTIDKLYEDNIITEVMVKGMKFYSMNSNQSIPNVRRDNGKYVCTFKGNRILLHIDDTENEESESVRIINYEMANHILTMILITINNKYKNGHNRTETQESATTGKNVLYL